MDHLTPYELGGMAGTVIGNTAVGTGVMLLLNAALKKLGKCQSYHTILIVMVLFPMNCMGPVLFGVTLWNRLHTAFVVLILVVAACASILYIVRLLWRKITAERD